MKYLITGIIIISAIQVNAQNPNSYASSTIGFPVSNLEESVEWYKQVLGDVEYFSPADGVVEFALNDKTWLQLFVGTASQGSILRLEVADIESQYNRLNNLVSPTPIELVPDVVSYFDFKDPDGNQLSFYKLE